jgi:signal transduction histidine kinase
MATVAARITHSYFGSPTLGVMIAVRRLAILTMRDVRRAIVRAATFAAFACLAPAIAPAAEPLPRSVLILDQTEPASQWGFSFRSGLRSVLGADPTAPIAIYSEVLDLGRFSGKEYEDLLRTSLSAKYRNKPIGVIVVHGSTALEILLRLRSELWSTVPVVFGVVDEATASRLTFPPDVTGTVVRLRLSNAVAVARAIVPNLKRIVLVGDPFERQTFRKHYVEELPQVAKEFEIIDLSGLPLAEVKERVAVLPDDAAIIYTAIYVDGGGMAYVPPGPIDQIAAAANRPIVGDAEPSMGKGATGGLMVVADPIARASAQIALRILNGEDVTSIPIRVGDFNKPMFDWRQLQRFGISEKQLPPGSEVIYRTLSLWDQYRWQLTTIFAVVLFQAALIGWLLYEHRRRSRAELESRGRLLEVIHLNRTASAGMLSASFSHELNQPLGAILSNTEAAELLLTTNPPDVSQVMEILADIRRDDQRAGDIIKNLGGLLRKKNQSELEEVDLNDAVRGALKLLDPEALNRGVVLNVIQAQSTLPVRADAVHLQQVILNLALNAMDAMLNCAPGSRKMTLGTALAGQTEVEVSVADTGTGIPSDKLKSVFETFFTTKPNGTGLGLSIARTIVETYGGRIWAENKLGGGAVFRFVLPLAQIQTAQATSV